MNQAIAQAFTYQGRLVDGTALANGNYEFTFRVYSASVLGTQSGPDVLLPAVGVTNGIFTVALNFGAGVFTGADRWLEMSARRAGTTNPVVVFSPRQAITAVPYALHALSGPVDASALTAGTLPDARLSANISRAIDVNTAVAGASNALSTRLVATNGLLAAQISTLNTRVTDVNNVLSTRLVGTNDALLNLIVALSARVVALEASSGPAPGSLLASVQPADPVYLGQGLLRAGGIPAPAWVAGSVANAPSVREGHSAVWTGQEMLIWGGSLGASQYSSSGAAYRPDSDRWTALSPVNAPTARSGHTATWSGTEMIIWGGFSGSTNVDTGARYDAVTKAWRTLIVTGAPTARDSHVAVWTGSRMLVWGGRNRSTLAAVGAQYRPSTDAWSPLSATDEPSPRMAATGVWAGDRWLVWGGLGAAGYIQSGGQLLCPGGTPSTWRAITTLGAPSGREGHAAVWTGAKMLIWGGSQYGTQLNDGGLYDPLTDRWTPLSGTAAPSARSLVSGVWTGSEWVLVGGVTAAGVASGGAAYMPATDTWRPLTNPGTPVARSGAASVWTGSELILFGGRNGTTLLSSLDRLTPQSAWYFYRKP